MQTNYNEILKQLDQIKPLEYARNRNFIDGSVTRLSPYISRGVILQNKYQNMYLKKSLSQKK